MKLNDRRSIQWAEGSRWVSKHTSVSKHRTFLAFGSSSRAAVGNISFVRQMKARQTLDDENSMMTGNIQQRCGLASVGLTYATAQSSRGTP